MIELGKVQELEIVRTKEFGVYLSEKAGDEAAVLLPKKQVPQGAQIGDKVEVFVYKDSSDRLTEASGGGMCHFGGKGCRKDRSIFGYGTGKGSASSL